MCQLTRYDYQIGHTYYYSKKSAMITDICFNLQNMKKQYSNGRRLHFKNIFILKTNKCHEEWFIQVYVHDVFEVVYCACHDLDRNIEVRYFCEELKRTPEDTSFNKCKNITEFREFLKRVIEAS